MCRTSGRHDSARPSASSSLETKGGAVSVSRSPFLQFSLEDPCTLGDCNRYDSYYSSVKLRTGAGRL